MARTPKQPPEAALEGDAGSSPRNRRGRKGHPKLRLELRDAKKEGQRELIMRFQAGLARVVELSRCDYSAPTVHELGQLVSGDSSNSRGVSPADTRSLREVLDRGGRTPGRPRPSAPETPVGDRLPPGARKQLACDVIEVLDVARTLLLDPLGSRGAFAHELELVKQLHALVVEHRMRRAVYAERARAAEMVVDLYEIYDRVAKEWPKREYDRTARQRVDPRWDETCARIMDTQRAALRSFCAKHGVEDPDNMVPVLEQTGLEIRAVQGAARAAPQALEKVFPRGDKTIDGALDASPFELTRSRQTPLLDSVRPDAWGAYADAASVLQAIFGVRTRTSWPSLSTFFGRRTWPQVRRDLVEAMLRVGGADRPSDPTQEHEWNVIGDHFISFVLEMLASARGASLMRELFNEFLTSEPERP